VFVPAGPSATKHGPNNYLIVKSSAQLLYFKLCSCLVIVIFATMGEWSLEMNEFIEIRHPE
jgi:hypothetical protein